MLFGRKFFAGDLHHSHWPPPPFPRSMVIVNVKRLPNVLRFTLSWFIWISVSWYKQNALYSRNKAYVYVSLKPYLRLPIPSHFLTQWSLAFSSCIIQLLDFAEDIVKTLEIAGNSTRDALRKTLRKRKIVSDRKDFALVEVEQLFYSVQLNSNHKEIRKAFERYVVENNFEISSFVNALYCLTSY